MDIATKISELLFNYECVVLPEFGGFITNDKPAQINRITHQFKPPHREILFNVQLKANDGLLAKHISETESISYKEAKQKVEEFVDWCRNELESGRQIEFAQIGKLYFDDNRHIVFEQDYQINYNPESFGLAPLVSPAIKRTRQEEKIKGIILPVSGTRKRTDRKAERISEENTSQSKKSIYRFPVAIAGLLVLVIMVTSLFLPHQSSLISFATLFPSSSTEDVAEVKPNQMPAQNIGQDKETALSVEEVGNKIVPEQNIVTEVAENKIVTNPVEEENQLKSEELSDESIIESTSEKIPVETVSEQPKAPKPDIDKRKPKIQPTTKQYYIIAGSFSKEGNAQKLIAQLTEKGYSAIVADTNKNGMYRVAYAGFLNKVDAKKKLLAIRQEENTEAWLLRK